MDLSKIKTLIDFVGRSNVTELSVTEKDVTVRIFRNAGNPAIVVPVSDRARPEVRQRNLFPARRLRPRQNRLFS